MADRPSGSPSAPAPGSPSADSPSAPTPGSPSAPAPGWKEVLLVAAGVVVVVLAAAVLTSLLPASVQQIVFKTPLAIVVLLVGTVWLLLRLARSDPPGQ